MTRQELRVFLQEHFCGCGDPESACRSLLRLLEQFSSHDHEAAYLALPKWIPDDGIMFLVLYWLDRQSLIEHGGGVLGSWLTDKGKETLEALRREAPDDFEALNEMSCVHGFDISGPCTHCDIS